MTNEQFEKAQAAKAERETPEYKIKLAIAVSENVKIQDIKIEDIANGDIFFSMFENRYTASANKRGDGIKKNSVRINRC